VSSPDPLLSDAAVDAAVTALAERNAHHFTEMSDAERHEAIATWRDLAVAVLTAATAATDGPESQRAPDEGGRAVIVLEDVGPEEIAVHASFFPQLEPQGEEVLATPAQAAALELLDGIAGELPEEG
jgi:hypothetical protein